MALAPIDFPKAPKTGAAQRLRSRHFVPTRRRRFERVGQPDSLATPSDIAMRTAGIHQGLR